jgi:hypothetical protein
MDELRAMIVDVRRPWQSGKHEWPEILTERS